MDENLEMEELSAEMPIEGMDLEGLAATNPTLAPFLQKYFSSMEAEGTALRQQAANREAQFKAAEEAIRQQRFGAPTTSEQLFALGSALLAPRRYRGLAGTLDKINPVFGQMEQLQRSSQSQRAQALENLQREYATAADEGRVASASAQREGLGKILPSVVSATKPQKQRTGFNPISGRLLDMDTGLPVTPPPPQVGEIRDGYKYLGGDPAAQTSWRKVV